MNKKGWKWLKKSISTSFQVHTAPESWWKYTTLAQILKGECVQSSNSPAFLIGRLKIGQKRPVFEWLASS